jgi:hypothetical protein
MGEYRRGLDWFDLLTTLPHDSELQIITEPSLVSTLYISLEHTVYCSQSVSGRFLVTAPIMAIPLSPVSNPLFTDSHTELTPNYELNLFLVCNISARTTQKHPVSSLACVSIAAGTCLPSRCPETGLVYPPISLLLSSNGSTLCNMFRLIKSSSGI